MPTQQQFERDNKIAARPQPQRGSPAHTASRGTGTSRRLNNNNAQNSASTAARFVSAHTHATTTMATPRSLSDAVAAEDLGSCVDLVYAQGWDTRTPASFADLSAALLEATKAGTSTRLPRICKFLTIAGAQGGHTDAGAGARHPVAADALAVAAAAQDLGACIDLVHSQGGGTPAHVPDLSAALRDAAKAGAARVCKVLVIAGAGANHGGDDGRTPLIQAAMEGRAATVAVLLAAPGVAPNQADKKGATPGARHFATQHSTTATELRRSGMGAPPALGATSMCPDER